MQTKVFNQAVRRNSSRFPEDFAFQLTTAEVAGLRSQTVTSNQNTLEDYEDTGTGRNRRGGRRYRPWAFTEHGAIMAANILHSDRAIQMSLFVVRAFVRLREHITANQAIPKRLAEIDRTLLEHDSALLDLYEKLLPLMETTGLRALTSQSAIS